MSRFVAVGTTGLGALAFLTWCYKERRSPKSAACVFVAPAANTAKVRNLVAKLLCENNVRIVKEVEISASDISNRCLFDKHHIAVASTAVLSKPSQLKLSDSQNEQFRNVFGLSWDHAVSSTGLVFNALEACMELACTADELDAAWLDCKDKGNFVKLGDSLECGYVVLEGTKADLQRRQGIFVINGFFARIRKDFICAGPGMHYYEVDLDKSVLSWNALNDKIVGSNGPRAVLGDSLQDRIRENWKELGLNAEVKPNSLNGVLLASTSPFEALANRMNWRGIRCNQDSYCRGLLQAGVQEKSIEYWLGNPEVHLPNGQRSRVFEVFKQKDVETSVDYAVTLQTAMSGC